MPHEDGGLPADAVGTSAEPSSAWPTETIAAYLTEHRVLERVNASIEDAVRARAPNPLLHMAGVLRASESQQIAVADMAIGLQCASNDLAGDIEEDELANEHHLKQNVDDGSSRG